MHFCFNQAEELAWVLYYLFLCSILSQKSKGLQQLPCVIYIWGHWGVGAVRKMLMAFSWRVETAVVVFRWAISIIQKLDREQMSFRIHWYDFQDIRVL